MIKILLNVLISIFLISTSVSAEIIKNIDVEGNKRVSKDTIINFSELKVGESYSEDILNNALKELYNSNFFEKVNLNFDSGKILISVKELPIIQEIIINGIKAEKHIKDIKENMFLKEKSPFNKDIVINDVDKMLNIFKSSGYYFVKIDSKIVNNSNDTVNLIFDIDRGEKATIKKINFIGDKFYKDRKLHSIITSEKDYFWKFISNRKYLDPNRINLDKRLLKNYYLENGYYKVIIKDAYSQLLNEKDFVLTFNIDAGEVYYFGDFNLNLPDDFDIKKFAKLEKIFNKLSNKKYDFSEIEKILDEIERISLFENYEFIDANIDEKIVGNKINFNFKVIETEKLYVNRINIFGNHITSEEFIRDNLYIDEGDPFNKILQNKSINNLKSKGIFGSVSYKMEDTDVEDLKNINLYIDEKATGEISAGAGYGTDGSSIVFGVKENNFNGRGIELETNLQITEQSLKGSFSYTHPNFLYSDRSLTTQIESTSTDKLTESGYKSSLNRVYLATRYEQFDNLYFSPSLSVSGETIETDASASSAYKKQEGSYFETVFGYGLTYDKRDKRFQPSSGYLSKFIQFIPVISDDGTLINGYQLTSYKEPIDNMIISTGIYSRAANSLTNDDVRVSKRLYVPSSRLRGFESGKVGPKDGNDYIGGNYVATFNASSTVPFLLETIESVDLKVFFDAANIWGVDYSSSIDDSNTIRSSTGLAVEVLTPVGPLSFSYAEAISKASTDKTQSFRFQLGTTF